MKLDRLCQRYRHVDFGPGWHKLIIRLGIDDLDWHTRAGCHSVRRLQSAET